MKNYIHRYWDGDGGGSEVLRLAFPFMVSTSAVSVQMFINRVFLMWYDRDGMSGATQGGIASFTAMALFLGIVGYVSTFVAQYTGAKRDRRIGPSIWQGIYFAIIAGILMLGLVWVAEPLFALAGHSPRLRTLEAVYFSISCIGGLPTFASSALSCFFTGRGKAWVVLWVDLASCLVNVALDYCLIFGHLGFPQWGVAGAAWASVAAQVIRTLVYGVLIWNRENEKQFAAVSGWRPEADLLKRMIRFGLPNGIQFMLDVMAFAFFLAIVGRMGDVAMAASSIVFQLNQVAFMPMIGMGTAVSVLVGQRLGDDKPQLAVRTTWNAALMCFAYMSLIAIGYVTIPGLFMLPFAGYADPAQFAPTREVIIKLLYFVAFYSLFDTGNIIFSATLKGAGDTRFVMIWSVGLSWLLLVVPSWLAWRYHWGLYAVWFFATSYVCLLAAVFLGRVLHGKWKTMRVIE
jgi:MATE family multidrug resistance protein